MSPNRLTVLVLTALTLTPACKNEDPGSLIVTYRLGNDKSCQEAGVQEIHVVLDEENGIEESAACAAGQVEILGLPVGNYNVDVTGIDANGVVIMDNIDDGTTKANVTGSGKELMPAEIALTDAPAKLEVRWDFGFTSCENTGIDSFEIEAFDESGSASLVSGSLGCSDLADNNDGYHFVADPDRNIDGRRLGEVGVQPVDSDGVEVGDRVLFTIMPPSPGYTVQLTFDCVEGGCTSPTGVPD